MGRSYFRFLTRTALCATIFTLSTTAQAETKFSLGGYIKLDAMYTEYSDGDLGANSGLRDFHIPGAIPVGGVSEDTDFDAHAKETRINFKTDTGLDNGESLTTFIEMDFLLPVGGNERVSNSYDPRLRHAFVKWNRGARGSWLFGQYWDTFMIITLPEDLDFIGTAEGTTFGRNPQVRWTSGTGKWEFAIENPESTITPNGGGGRIVTDDNAVPDLVARYNHKFANGSVSVAAIARQLAANFAAQGNAAIDDTETGFGVSVGGKFKVGAQDDIRFLVTTGSGLGRYFGLNFANGAVVTTDGSLEAIDSSGGFVGYRHCWTPGCKWRSNVNYSVISVDNDVALTGSGVSKSASSVSANLLYSPHPKFTLGVEYMHADREVESGADGDMDRLQFSAKYAIGYSN